MAGQALLKMAASGVPRLKKAAGAGLRGVAVPRNTVDKEVDLVRRSGRQSTFKGPYFKKSFTGGEWVGLKQSIELSLAYVASDGADDGPASAKAFGKPRDAPKVKPSKVKQSKVKPSKVTWSGAAMVGKRVKVNFEEGQYKATVAGYNQQNDEYFLKYDNGDEEWLRLPHEDVRIISSSGSSVETTGAQANGGAKSASLCLWGTMQPAPVVAADSSCLQAKVADLAAGLGACECKIQLLEGVTTTLC